MKKVVVAESSPTIKSVADSLLRQSGYDVICTSDGLRAWEIIAAEKPDLVLAGLGLSGISGLDLCRQIGSDRLTGGIPVVLMIGANDSIREDELVAAGARGKLKKPFSPKDLLEIVNKLAGYGRSAEPPAASPGSQETKFVAQVSSTQHQKLQETYNLEWLDISDSSTPGSISKTASFDLANEDQALVIDEDQYGLSSPIFIPEEPPASPVEEKDDDYDWFVGEMKREMEGKASGTARSTPTPQPGSAGPSADVPKITSEIGFEDIRPSDGPGKPAPRSENSHSALDSSILRTRPFPADIREPVSPPPARPASEISDEQLARIVDRVAARLATLIVSRLDRNLIIEAIKAELNS
ncbi:MAG: hypothetical protein A2W25_16005 [candidate division Zixibacteria bacterium RBG_16_53_22]|nr:MAG: hypothetical protein A2W25_16005 [candidate division Zixibacteria bacterium RBG_16_53_22]